MLDVHLAHELFDLTKGETSKIHDRHSERLVERSNSWRRVAFISEATPNENLSKGLGRIEKKENLSKFPS
jgi:hypothetical protein